MSHVAAVDVQILDLEALKRACETLGLEFRKGKKTFKWYGTWVNDYHGNDAAYKNGVNPKDYGKCQHAIGIKGNDKAYEIGLISDPDKPGGYKMVYDFWQGGLGIEKVAGKGCNNLINQYAKEVAISKVKKLGYTVTEKTNANGEIEIEATKW